MKRPLAKRVANIAVRAAAGLLALPLLYLLFAFILGLIPANGGWQEPKQGITIFIRSNGVHTWVMVPKVTDEMDWRPWAPGAHLNDARWGGGNYVGFGYGNRTFYLETPTWGDLSMKNVLLAAFGSGRSLIHADHEHDPRPDDYQRPIVLTRAQYAKLVLYLRAGFQLDAQGRTMPLIGRGYGGSDMFYEAVGPYNAFLTCNEWTGRALRQAGVRAGLWTPFAQSIMWRLD